MPLSLVWITSSKLSARADPEAGTDHILKPHDCDALQRSWTLQSCHHRHHVIIDVTDINKNLHAPDFSNFIVRGEVGEDSQINTVVMHVTDPDADSPKAIPVAYILICA